MADKTVNEGLLDTVKELKETNKRLAKAQDALVMQSKVGGKIGDAVLENAKKSTEGLNAFMGQLEQMPVFGAISGIGKALAGSALNAVMEKRRLAKEDALIAKQLGIQKEDVAERRKQQELRKAEEANAEKLLDVAKALGYVAEDFKIAQDDKGSTSDAAAIESQRQAARDADRRFDELGETVSKAMGKGGDKKDDKPSWLSALTGGFSSLLGGLHALPGKILTGFGVAIKSVVTAIVGLGKTLILGLGRRLGGLRRGLGRAIKGLPKAMGKLPAFAKGLASKAGSLASGAGGLLKGGLGIAKTAAKFAGPIGLAVTAGMGIFDGLTAGIEEYKKSGKIGAAVKEGFAGAVSGLTFGLVDQETISAGFDKIGDFAVQTVDGLKNAASAGFEKAKELTNLGVAKFEELTGLTVPKNLTEVRDAVGNALSSAAEGFNKLTGLSIPTNLTELKDTLSSTFTSAAEGFNNLTGLNIPTNLGELKDTLTTKFKSAAEGFTNLTGLTIPTNLTELKDGLKSKFDSIGASFTNLTGIEVPKFDDLQEKVTQFADDMKNKISEGWQSITSTVGGWWDKAKSAVGLGDDVSEQGAEAIRKEIQEAEDRIARSKAGEDVYGSSLDNYFGRESVGIENDMAKIAELNKKMQLSLAAAEDGGEMDTSGIPLDAYPVELRDGGNGKYYYYRRLGPGNYRIADDQNKAKQAYELAVANSGGMRRLEQMGTATSENQALQRQQQGGGTTVVDASNKSTNINGGGGGSAPIPIATKDNSSASVAAAVANF